MKRNCFIRILSYNDECHDEFFGENLKYDLEWDAYVLEKELEERPNIWKLIDRIRDAGFKFDQFDIVEDWWENYDCFICVTIEKR